MTYLIGEAARRVGVSASALRLWERQGLVRPMRSSSRYRLYSDADLDHLVVELHVGPAAHDHIELFVAQLRGIVVWLLEVLVHDLLARLGCDEGVRRKLADAEIVPDLFPFTNELKAEARIAFGVRDIGDVRDLVRWAW